jgi:dihydrofolate synthase / folylpolyglutamate synthase
VDSGLSEYKAALDALFARTGSTAKFGLDRTFRFLELLGNPQARFPAFHVAGTNGKGSVVAAISALLASKGYRVGRYMSPHLVDFRERIVVHGETVSRDYIVRFLERWSADAESRGATFFEITTAMALHYFAECHVDVAVIETGLGGRLDSTNVIDPLVAGITSIGLDHQQYLGTSEESIAREKAGIFKRGKPAVIGPLSAETKAAARQVAGQAGASLIEAQDLYATSDIQLNLDGTTFTVTHRDEARTMRTGLVGSAQAANMSVALAMLDAAGAPWRVSLDEAAEVLPHVSLPGRFQRVGNMILDVAHNPDGIRAVVSTLSRVAHATPVTAVLGVLADKDWRGMIDELSEIASRIVLVTAPSAPHGRVWESREALDYASLRGIDAVVAGDFERAIGDARVSRGTVIITGSFHTVGDALVMLGEKTL